MLTNKFKLRNMVNCKNCGAFCLPEEIYECAECFKEICEYCMVEDYDGDTLCSDCDED